MDYKYSIKNESNDDDPILIINALNDIDNTDHYELTDFKNEVNDLEDNLELTFLVNNSFSMTKFIEGIKRFIKQIIKDATIYLNDKKLPEDFLRISLNLYNDQNFDSEKKDDKICDFINSREFLDNKYLDKIVASEGDNCECVLAGLSKIQKLSWTKTNNEERSKFLFHFLDAPPHGDQFYCVVKNNLNKDCKCKLEYEEILVNIRNLNIDYTIIPLSESVKQMVDVFGKILKIDVYQVDFNKFIISE